MPLSSPWSSQKARAASCKIAQLLKERVGGSLGPWVFVGSLDGRVWDA